MPDIHSQRQQPVVGIPVQRFYTADGPVYVPADSEIRTSQPIRRETVRVTRRRVETLDGRAGFEIIEEHDVVYGTPRACVPSTPDPTRVGLAGFTAFVVICLAFTALGGGEQSPGMIPVWWGAFAGLWWALS